MDTIYNKLIELRKKQEALAVYYEEKASYEMAYLSRWYVLEKILKIIDTKLKTDELQNKVRKWWEEYVANPDSDQPEPLKSFQLQEAQRIPYSRRIEEIEKYFNKELPIIKEIMHTKSGNSSTKWRRWRNNIAHRAKPFDDKEKYESCRDKIMEGISEIEQALNGNCVRIE